MYRVLSNEAPVYISNMYTHTPSRCSSSRNYQLNLPRPMIVILKTSVSFSGAYLWNNLPLTVRSFQSLSSFKRKLRAHLEVVTSDGVCHNTARESDWGFRVIAIAMNGNSRPILYTHRTPPCHSDCLWESPLFPPPLLSLTVLYKKSIDCVLFVFLSPILVLNLSDLLLPYFLAVCS